VKLALLAVGLGLGAAAPYIFSPFIISILTLALVMGLFAMSIDLLTGYGGLTTLGQAGILATAAYGVGYIAARTGGGHLEQILVGLGAGVAVSAIFAAMSMRTSGIYFVMVTAAQGMIVWGLALRLSSITGAENGLRGIARPPMISAYWQYYYATLAVVAVCGGLLYIVVRSPFGLSFRGLKDSEKRLQALGFNTVLHKFYGFMLSGLFATIAGILFVYSDRFISPASSQFLASANGVLMAILGGLQTLVGPLIGGLVIVFTENVLSSYVERWPTVLGLVFIATILFARRGLVGGISNLWHGWLDRGGRGETGPPAPSPSPEPRPTGEPIAERVGAPRSPSVAPSNKKG
jgi:branched-chain amino acid transport system permease protein